MKQNASSSDSFGSIDEEVLKELKNVPMVLATQDEMDMRDVARGLRHRLKVWNLDQPCACHALSRSCLSTWQRHRATLIAGDICCA